MNYVTSKDIEKINEIIYKYRDSYTVTWNDMAKKAGWSVSTIRKYYDKAWYPGKYYKSAIKVDKKYDYGGAGLYLLTQQIVEDNKIINLVKIGKSRNLVQRLNSYKGMNPFAKCIDTLNCVEEDLDALEKGYHMLLGTKNHRYGNTEWFICDDEEFKYWSNYKFVNIKRKVTI